MHKKQYNTSFPSRNQYKNYDSSSINRTNSSAHSEHLRKMIDEQSDMYPPGFAELLRGEERNIRVFKNQIGKEKERIDEDMSAFKTEMNHTLEDLRLSLHAHLDRIYQDYMTRYSKFKGEIFEINRLKDQIEIQYPSSSIKKSSQSMSSSNMRTIAQMEEGSREMKKIHFLNYIAELQKERILPLNDLQREIVILTEYRNGFYQSEEFRLILGSLKGMVNDEVGKIYTNCHLYIREMESLLFKEEPKILDAINQKEYPSGRIFKSQTAYHEPGRSRLNEQPVRGNNAEREGRMYTKIGSPLYGEVGNSQQTVQVDWLQNLNMIESNKMQIDRSLTPLCGISVANQFVFGLKDGAMAVFSPDGRYIRTLEEHRANICTLSILKFRGVEYLASGADHGCSKIIIWNPSTWQVVQQYEHHSAAVTAIVDLKDNCHFLSGGYDKKLNVYSMEQSRMVYNLPANQTSVSGAIVNKSGSRVVTCGLDKSLNVWQVSNQNGKVETMFLERKIQNNALICSIIASELLDDFVVIGTHDRKIKMVNIEKGESYKTIACADSDVIELVMIERKSKPYYPFVVAWPLRDPKVHVINTENSTISTKAWQGELFFGCGIGPKAFLHEKGARLLCLSHDEHSKHTITDFKLEELR